MGTAIDMAFDGATLAACPLSALVLSFAFYGFCGWAWESTVCAMLNHGRFANSGFLLGPCCPIYGAGGIACWLLLRGIPDASSQFVAAALVCSVIEYSVGVLLEKTTGARFWDYSHLPFNLHGRICLYWACAFGLGALCICRLVEPALLGLLGHLPVLIVRLAAFAVAVAMAVDALCSLASWRRLSDQLERVRADLADRINESLADLGFHARAHSRIGNRLGGADTYPQPRRQRLAGRAGRCRARCPAREGFGTDVYLGRCSRSGACRPPRCRCRTEYAAPVAYSSPCRQTREPSGAECISQSP